ncbi:glycosyltransferase family 9 protein [candidate division TA06 bacterium]|uniref:Glycosyltransferase family 9 protein n=1 Tax=candidate division TA06 bacterium TaxID=2250710 RepID=A0A933IC90_UNCT6|nr:glycosyltransferase family 9 protein [candidate division TA06 bacterium]
MIAFSQDIDEVVTDEGTSVFKLAGVLRAKRFDCGVLLHPTLHLAAALWLAKIPVRAGTAYRGYSLFFNRRVKQHRRDNVKHELEYNIDLIYDGLRLKNGEGQRYLPPVLTVPDQLKENLAKEYGRDFILLHPGSSRSSKPWPLENFAKLANRIQGSSSKVVISLGPQELGYKTSLKKHLTADICWAENLPLADLAALISLAKALITNNTGPLHVAVAANTIVIGIYCPTCAIKRWGPYGPGHTVIRPQVGFCKECHADKCREYDCMEKITAEDVYKKVKEL